MRNEINTDLRDTIEDIIQDVILLEAMVLRTEQHNASKADVSSDMVSGTFRRVLSYLSQHAFDLHTLTSHNS